jgi:hypothetical protein
MSSSSPFHNHETPIWGPTLRTHGISHVFSPVLSKETKLHYWEHVKAKKYATEAGYAVVSDVLARASGAGIGG